MRWNVSDAWDAAVRRSHNAVVRVDVCTFDGTVLDSFAPTGGSVTVAGSQAVRREVSLVVVDEDGTLTPAAPGDLLSLMSGNELRPYRGIRYDDGTEELAPLGVFPIRANPADGYSVSPSGGDRSTSVALNGWTYPHPIAEGTELGEALATLLSDRLPGCPVDFPATPVFVPAVTFGLDGGGDPWADASTLAADNGYTLFFDQAGTARLEQEIDPATATPELTYAADDDAVVISASKEWDGSGAFNGGLVIGESSDGSVPVRVEVWDDDPDSPTYFLGPYGRRPWPPIVTPQATSIDAANALGARELAKRRGVAQTVSWSQVPDPSLDAGVAVALSVPRLRLASVTAVVEQMTVPLSVSEAITVRARTPQIGAR